MPCSAENGPETRGSRAQLFGLGALLARAVGNGSLAVTDSAGRQSRFGEAGRPPDVHLRFTDRMTPLRIVADPALGAGEAYMDGWMVLERGTLRQLFAMMEGGGISVYGHLLNRLRRPFRRLVTPRANRPLRAARNARHHYDLPDTLYELFLDADLQYSCAYFERPGMGLEDAQSAKKRLIARKLLLEPGHRVLDIGCGWGGLGLELAGRHHADVTGITLSPEQARKANARASASGLGARARFRVEDYRKIAGGFDRIVSVGMFEHVGVPHYREYFAALHRLLAPGGVALIHSIGRMGPPYETDSWTAKYIFPGGYIPSLSEVMPAIEKSGLWLTDMEILRLHYAETLKHWGERFAANRMQAHALMGERFCRMWEFYLASSEMAFRSGTLMVFQLQLARDRDAVPLTRDYLLSGTSTAAPLNLPDRRSASARLASVNE